MLNPVHIGIDVSHRKADVGVTDSMGEQIDTIRSFPNNLSGRRRGTHRTLRWKGSRKLYCTNRRKA